MVVSMSRRAASSSFATRSFALATSAAPFLRASFQQLGALIKQSLARSFLLNVYLRARLLQSFLVLLDFFRSGGLRGFGGFASAGGSRLAFGHYLKQRLEEKRSQNAVKSEQDQDCRHSLKEQFPKLVNDLLHLACVA